MRTVFLAAGLTCLAGCGKPSESSEERNGPNTPTVTDPSAKVKVLDLSYAYQTDPVAAKEKYTGKKLLVEFTFAKFTKDRDGKPVLLYASDDGFRRPRAVARLENTHSTPGDKEITVYIEGAVVGLADFDDPRLATWKGLAPQPGEKGEAAIVIEDARIVPGPK